MNCLHSMILNVVYLQASFLVRWKVNYASTGLPYFGIICCNYVTGLHCALVGYLDSLCNEVGLEELLPPPQQPPQPVSSDGDCEREEWCSS